MIRKERSERNDRDGKKKRPRRDEAPRKRSRFLENVIIIDVNDADFMRQFVTEHGKIIPARLTGASAKQQRVIKAGVRRAREIGLIA